MTRRPPNCITCDDTGFKDYAGHRMEPCECREPLLPCPFCSSALMTFQGHAQHPVADCILSGYLLGEKEYRQWNNRAYIGLARKAFEFTVNPVIVSEVLAEGDGFWHSCSGCHETNEGVPLGPFSDAFKCHLGTGCGECGGLGAVWDTTDYSDLADHALGRAHPDDLAVARFAEKMRAKMQRSREVKGRSGWNDPAQCSTADLRRGLYGHLRKDDPVDVANFCMMLDARGAGTAWPGGAE